MSTAYRVRGGLFAALLAVLLVSTTAYAIKTSVVTAWLGHELVKLPGSHAPGETREDYEKRVGVDVATAIVEEATPYANGTGWSSTEIAASAAIIWYGESLFDLRVHAGQEHPLWHGDHGLAHCPMQLHQSKLVPPDIWARLAGVDADATHLCARYGIRVMIAQARQCGVFVGVRADRNRVAQTFAGYASGGKCKPTERDWQRADLWLKMMANRPDNEKRVLPGYRRARPGEIPPRIVDSARGIASEIGKEPEIVPGFKRTEYGPRRPRVRLPRREARRGQDRRLRLRSGVASTIGQCLEHGSVFFEALCHRGLERNVLDLSFFRLFGILFRGHD